MNIVVRVTIYLLLALGMAWFGYAFNRKYSALMSAPEGKVEAVKVDETSSTVTSREEMMVKSPEGNLFGTFCGFLACSVVLALLVGRDVSNYLASKANTAVYFDDSKSASSEYEVIDTEWANGNYLEAIRLLREYYQKHPKEIHANIRIAEIYEKDLNNHLAAAMEYEDVLKHKLRPDRWGWTAIHLCNLYFKLDRVEEAVALLRRIDTEYGQTPAAEKARKRLALMDGHAQDDSSEPGEQTETRRINPIE